MIRQLRQLRQLRHAGILLGVLTGLIASLLIFNDYRAWLYRSFVKVDLVYFVFGWWMDSAIVPELVGSALLVALGGAAGYYIERAVSLRKYKVAINRAWTMEMHATLLRICGNAGLLNSSEYSFLVCCRRSVLNKIMKLDWVNGAQVVASTRA